jgi:hypothetical protein
MCGRLLVLLCVLLAACSPYDTDTIGRLVNPHWHDYAADHPEYFRTTAPAVADNPTDPLTWCKPWANERIPESRCHYLTQAGIARERAQGLYDQPPSQVIYTIMPRMDGSVDIIPR